MRKNKEFHWWQKGVIYEIYVRSFMDSNGDGIGDLRGITQRLDYLKWLGVKAIWITPVYPSPMKDLGYDVSNYTDICSEYGTMKDFTHLLKEVHKRDMKLIMDLVHNHTSDQHPWFRESRSSKKNKKRDWYIWQDAKEDGSAPNNWVNHVGESAWQWDETTQQYYLHSFLKEQPDLNYNNKEVCNAIFDVMRFWLDKGIDGFRVDSMAFPIKDRLLRNDPPNPHYETNQPRTDKLVKIFSTNQAMVHVLIRKMRKVMDEYDDTVMIGEIYLPISSVVAYYGMDNNEAQLPANYQLISTRWTGSNLAVAIAGAEANVPPLAWAHWALSNHDKDRLISRVGKEQAKVAAILLLTLRGTPCMYYGDEIGMHNVMIPFDEAKDSQGKAQPELHFGRDAQRTPMQWDSTKEAGFTMGKPWLRIGTDYKELNVAAEKEKADSILMLYQRLLQLRNSEPALAVGEYIPVYADSNILAYMRMWEDEDSFLIVLNLGTGKALYEQRERKVNGTIELATNIEREGESITNIIHMDGGEGILVRIKEIVN